MAKTYLSTVKYVIKTDFLVKGIVDKHDIIGAIFIGEEMDLKELQKNGKLGRIEVDTQTKSGKTVGTLTIPSSLDRVQTSILAAAIESIDKVGPCDSSFKTESIEDARREKRKAVTERAKELLLKMGLDMPETQELTEAIREKARTSDLREIGRDKVPIGPDVDTSSELILVEGRADVINLLKHGIKNVAAVGGANIPRTIINLAKGKEVTLFVDGDRGGDIIARQLGQAMKLDFVTKAPDGKEVEELTLKEILAALRKKTEGEQALKPRRPRFESSCRSPRSGAEERRPSYRSPRSGAEERRPSYRSPRSGAEERHPRERTGFRSERGPGNRGERQSFGRERPSFRGRNETRLESRSGFGRPRPFPSRSQPPLERRAPLTKPNDLKEFSKPMQELEGSLKARFLDEKMHTAKEVNVRDLLKDMKNHKGASAIVLDGIVTKRLFEEAEKNGIKHLIGVKKGRIEESKKVKVSTLY